LLTNKLRGVAILATVASLTAAVAGLSRPATAQTEALTWAACPPDSGVLPQVGCATVQVPLDYAKPNGRQVTQAKKVAAQCGSKARDLLPYITTENAARDIDRIRIALQPPASTPRTPGRVWPTRWWPTATVIQVVW